jgi:hypothetical protein
MNNDIDPSKLSSLEAAALYLSDGATKDPAKAAIIDANKKNELNMDALQRAHLRRMMGFNFRIKMQPNKIHVSSTQDPYVTTWCRITGDDVINGQITNEATLDRLVDACARLKGKYDKALAKEAK